MSVCHAHVLSGGTYILRNSLNNSRWSRYTYSFSDQINQNQSKLYTMARHIFTITWYVATVYIRMYAYPTAKGLATCFCCGLFPRPVKLEVLWWYLNMQLWCAWRGSQLAGNHDWIAIYYRLDYYQSGYVLCTSELKNIIIL